MSSGRPESFTCEYDIDDFNNFLEHLNQLHLLVLKIAEISILAESYDCSNGEIIYFVNKE